ncbi:cytochrome c oxidase subunit II [Granulosicoccus sp. 3-233]|uniref:cytochrome c oxidase subunit II n=1 Tax=Granulosicoccus sp. 3-233 TaxID=3417969 RepID=UPI003D332864
MLPLGGCGGLQSTLQPAGKEAAEIATLFHVLLVGAVVLWLLVNGIFLYVTRLNPRPLSRRAAEGLIIGGGILFPTVLLGILLAYSMSLMSSQRETGNAATSVSVTGEQWWWRVQYRREDGSLLASANELRLPAGERTEVTLTSNKVIHSFWVPALAGKMDMFPGRVTRLALQPETTGIYRGQCAEFCGTSHALMAFQVVVMTPEDFERWLEEQATPAAEPEGMLAMEGRQAFLREGCGACHTVRGTPAAGTTGPDLTHVGGRTTLGAGILPSTPEDFTRWIQHTDTIKPDVYMPSYDHLDQTVLEALGHYLKGLM